MHVKRTTPRLSLLSTPDPVAFPLTSPYGADGRPLRPAAVYIRESERDQGEYSFETQYERARDVLRHYGFYVTMVRVDSKSGSKITRTGYGDVEKAVKDGLVEAVGVYMMARWGRRAWERLRIAHEFDRLDVLVYDASRARADVPGLERVIWAGVDEQFLRDLSTKAVDNMPKAARAGKHAAPTPIGYKRAYPQGQDYDRKVASVMVPDEQYGPLVQEIFRLFVHEGYSGRALARWLNAGQLPNPKSEHGRWDARTVRQILRHRVYGQYEDTEYGQIEWGKTHTGDWSHYKGEVITAQGQHAALIDRATFEAAQRRLAAEARAQRWTQRGSTPGLLAGFLVCARCGSDCYLQGRGTTRAQYVCADRHRCLSSCAEPSISYRVADAAVLAEVARLRGAPWQPQPLEAMAARDPHAAERRRLRAQIGAASAEMDAHVRSFSLANLAGEPTQEEIVAFRRRSQEISARITQAKDELDALPEVRANALSAQQVHALLAQAEISALVRSADADGDRASLRQLLDVVVQSARIVERWPSARRTTWARAEVEWTPDVQLLLDAGLLRLEAAPQPPTERARVMAAERARRYRARKKAGTTGA